MADAILLVDLASRPRSAVREVPDLVRHPLEPAVVTIFMITGSDVDGHAAFRVAPQESRPVFRGLRHHLFRTVPPTGIHDISRIEMKVRTLVLEAV